MEKKNNFIILNLILIVSFLLFITLSYNAVFYSLDKKVNSAMQTLQTPSLVFISKIISNIFEPAIFAFLFLLVIVYLFYRKRKKEAYALAFLTLFSFALLELTKLIVQRARPINSLISENTFSFPSGHALMAIVFFGMLLFLFEHHIRKTRIRVLLTILDTALILVISLSRVYLNVHWLSDVIASFALGSFLVVLYILVINHTTIFKRS